VTTVVGLDLSLTATGVAVVDSGAMGGGYMTTTIKTLGHRNDSLSDRWERINGIAGSITGRLQGHAEPYGRNWLDADLVVIEGPSVMSKGGSNWDRAWLWGAVVDLFLSSHVRVAVASPSTVKKWATDRGNADKASVAVAVARLWDQFECESDNEADALALASMGAQRLGVDIPQRSQHLAALEKVAWPDLTEVTHG
jgi:crossover junction endodeoxyribonuclease RuvC